MINRMMNAIARLWGIMREHVTPGKRYATCGQFADATLGFRREKIFWNWANFRDSVAANFRVIKPKDFRIMA